MGIALLRSNAWPAGAFLKTPTGDQPQFLRSILPPSTEKTPPKPFG
jgi:hypothetical protein